MRLLLCNVVSLCELDGREVDFQFLNTTMPGFGEHNLLQAWRFRTIPRFIKTHQPYRPVLFAVPQRTVYILRDPRDVMVSYYHYQRSRIDEPFQGSFAEFIRDARYGVDACIQHYLSWQRRITVVIRYEDLRRNTVGELCRLLSTLHVAVREDIAQQAVERASFDKMKSLENQGSEIPGIERFDAQFRFFREGRAGQWPDYFGEGDMDYYRSRYSAHGFHLYE